MGITTAWTNASNEPRRRELGTFRQLVLLVGFQLVLWAAFTANSSVLLAQQQPAATPKETVPAPAIQPRDIPAATGDKATPPPAPALGSQAEREATAMNLLKEHHVELVDLVERLKVSKPVEYERAIRELARTSDRLAVLKQRDPERYALELEAWKLKSHIRLLSARASMPGQSTLAEELRTALERQHAIRLKQLELDRADLTEKLQRVEASLDQLKKNPQTQIDKQLETLLRSIDTMRTKAANRNPKKSPANTVNQNPSKSPPKKKPKGSGSIDTQ